MTKINIKVDLEFKIGEEVYYCPQIKESGSDVYVATIKAAKINYTGKRSTVKYVINYTRNEYGHLEESIVSTKSLYSSQISISDLERVKKKQRLMKKTAAHKKAVQNKTRELKKLQSELDEIKKEELIIDISGIGGRK